MILQPSMRTGAEREVPEVAREDLQVIFYSIMSNISIFPSTREHFPPRLLSSRRQEPNTDCVTLSNEVCSVVSLIVSDECKTLFSQYELFR